MLEMEMRFENRSALLVACVVVLMVTAAAGIVQAQEEHPSSAGNQIGGVQQSQRRAALPDVPKPRQRQNSLNSGGPIPPRRLSFGERFDIYVHSISNLETVGGPAFGALVSQANDDPPEWGQGAAGYARRFGSGYGRMLITRTIRFGVAAADHEDPLFHPSGETTFWRRARYATVHYFIVRTDGGTPIPAFSRFAGVYGSAFIANAWYPSSHATNEHAVLRGSTAMAAGVGWNVFREFWPDIKNALPGHK